MNHPYKGQLPRIHETCFIADSAQIIGRVSLGANSSVWYNAVLRADLDDIRIGSNTNIQDGCLLHNDTGLPLIIGDNVTLGHGVIAHACTIEDNCQIGMGSIVLNGAYIGHGSIIGAGAVVPPRMQVPPNSQVMGVPGRVVKALTPEAEQNIARHGQGYARLAEDFKREQK